MPVAQLFHALGDPIRLKMVSRLSDENSLTIGTLSSNLGISRQGARKHIRTLSNAHVITLTSQGRDTYVQLNRDSLSEGMAFINKMTGHWEKRLESLRQFVEEA